MASLVRSVSMTFFADRMIAAVALPTLDPHSACAPRLAFVPSLFAAADRKKIAAAMPMFDLYSAELVEVDEPMWHMARFLPSVK